RACPTDAIPAREAGLRRLRTRSFPGFEVRPTRVGAMASNSRQPIEGGEMKRNLLIAAACLTTAVVLVPAALADPVNAKNASQITAMCNGQPVTVVVNGNGTFSPAHVIANTSVFIPTAFDLTFTFTPSDGSGAIVDTN